MALKKFICFLIGHKSHYESGGFMGVFVYPTACERCGKKEVKLGILNRHAYQLWWWLDRRIWFLRCDFDKWIHRNDPPPF